MSKSKYGRCLSIVLLSTGLMMAMPASLALADIDHRAARELRLSGKILPLERIIEVVREIKTGIIIETELEFEKGRYIYEVEILDDDGLVWEIELDAATAEILKIELDD